jgi:hypothetical protein
VGTRFPPGFLLTTIMALATAWSAVSPFGPSLDPEAANHPAALRQHIADAVDLIVNAQNRRRLRRGRTRASAKLGRVHALRGR